MTCRSCQSNSTYWQNCLRSLTVSDEDFLFSLAVLAVFHLLLLLLSVTTIMLAWKTRTRVWERIECKWNKTFMKSLDTFDDNHEGEVQRPFLTIWDVLVGDDPDQEEQKSAENSCSVICLPVTSEMSTIKEEEQEEANLCLEMLHDPRRFYDNLGVSQENNNMVNLVVRRLSVISSQSEGPAFS